MELIGIIIVAVVTWCFVTGGKFFKCMMEPKAKLFINIGSKKYNLESIDDILYYQMVAIAVDNITNYKSKCKLNCSPLYKITNGDWIHISDGWKSWTNVDDGFRYWEKWYRYSKYLRKVFKLVDKSNIQVYVICKDCNINFDTKNIEEHNKLKDFLNIVSERYDTVLKKVDYMKYEDFKKEMKYRTRVV